MIAVSESRSLSLCLCSADEPSKHVGGRRLSRDDIDRHGARSCERRSASLFSKQRDACQVGKCGLPSDDGGKRCAACPRARHARKSRRTPQSSSQSASDMGGRRLGRASGGVNGAGPTDDEEGRPRKAFKVSSESPRAAKLLSSSSPSAVVQNQPAAPNFCLKNSLRWPCVFVGKADAHGPEYHCSGIQAASGGDS